MLDVRIVSSDFRLSFCSSELQADEILPWERTSAEDVAESSVFGAVVVFLVKVPRIRFFRVFNSIVAMTLCLSCGDDEPLYLGRAGVPLVSSSSSSEDWDAARFAIEALHHVCS